MSALHRSASPSFWLATALIVMPALQLVPIDFDRSGVLFLLLPFLWSARKMIGPGLHSLGLQSPWIRNSAWVFLISTVIAVALSPHFAPALTTAACWLLHLFTGVVARQMILREPGTSERLLGAIALSVTCGTLAVWLLWLSGGRGAIPLYAHHRIFGLHTISGAVASISLVVRFWPYRNRRNIWLVIGAINWAGLFWSGGRGPALALLIGLAAWWAASDSSQKKRLMGASAALLAAGLLLSLALWSPRAELGWWNYIRRSTSANVGPALSISAVTATRSDFWRESLHHFQQRPWTGHGPDAYRFLTPKLDGQQPHNFIIQLLLDVGVLGTVAALILMGAAFSFSWRHLRRLAGETRTAPWFALAAASVVAGLLDGVYYHLLALLPAMLALTAMLAPDSEENNAGNSHAGAIAAMGAAAAVLVLHTAIFYFLVVGSAPQSPQDWRAQLVRKFPSTTFGLWRWLDVWQAAEPETALNWCRWAQEHSANAPSFHIYAARLLVDRGDRTGAVEELRSAHHKVHWTNQPGIAEMLHSLETPAR